MQCKQQRDNPNVIEKHSTSYYNNIVVHAGDIDKGNTNFSSKYFHKHVRTLPMGVCVCWGLEGI